jgi:hypothetical protein
MNDRLDWDTLKSRVTDIKLTADNGSAIVTVNFTYNGALMQALFHPDLEGLYGFEIHDPQTFFDPPEIKDISQFDNEA